MNGTNGSTREYYYNETLMYFDSSKPAMSNRKSFLSQNSSHYFNLGPRIEYLI